jgi:iron complex transport system ATP-binding protein
MISTANISFSVKQRELLKPTTVAFAPARFHVIMGANGAGKSTLLKLLADDLRPSSGQILYGSTDSQTLGKKLLARKRAVLSQHYLLNFPITVEEVVLMGRYPYFEVQPSARDLEICTQAMQLMEVEELLYRDYNTLSGGEAQKVQMSRVLAQIWPETNEEKVLFLDEPVSHLDIKYQHQLLQVAKNLCSQRITVIAILHDINLALSFADRILFLKKGKLIQDLTDPGQINTEIIKETFGISARIIQDGQRQRPIIIF